MRPHIPMNVRERVKARFGGRCGYCGDEAAKLTIDHIKPVAAGGSHEETNLMPACFSCNNYKTTFTLEGFRDQLQDQVERCRKYSLNYRLAERFALVAPTGAKVTFYFERHTQ